MSKTVKLITNESEFRNQLTANKSNLVVVDFFATWCGPCKRIAPELDHLAESYPDVVFLKVDVNECQEIAHAQGVNSMPTFIFFMNNVKVDRITGANIRLVEEKVRQYHRPSSFGVVNGNQSFNSRVGLMDLSPFVIHSQSEALNQSDDYPLVNAFKDDDSFLLSDTDNQLIIPITFSQTVKLHSLKIKAPASTGPKVMKLFINQPSVLDFDQAVNQIPTQVLTTSPTQLLSGTPIELQYVKFQSVQNMQIFVEENHSGTDNTRIDHLQFLGSPLQSVNMSDFKRVAGKKGEAHS